MFMFFLNRRKALYHNLKSVKVTDQTLGNKLLGKERAEKFFTASHSSGALEKQVLNFSYFSRYLGLCNTYDGYIDYLFQHTGILPSGYAYHLLMYVHVRVSVCVCVSKMFKNNRQNCFTVSKMSNTSKWQRYWNKAFLNKENLGGIITLSNRTSISTTYRKSYLNFLDVESISYALKH